jgi:hypothetical protein
MKSVAFRVEYGQGVKLYTPASHDFSLRCEYTFRRVFGDKVSRVYPLSYAHQITFIPKQFYPISWISAPVAVVVFEASVAVINLFLSMLILLPFT